MTQLPRPLAIPFFLTVVLMALQRWQKEPEFEKALREARMSAFKQSMARLQQASVPAVTTLMKLMVDPGSPATVKARCAYYILDQTRRGIETEEIEQRLAALEQAAEAERGRRR